MCEPALRRLTIERPGATRSGRHVARLPALVKLATTDSLGLSLPFGSDRAHRDHVGIAVGPEGQRRIVVAFTASPRREPGHAGPTWWHPVHSIVSTNAGSHIDQAVPEGHGGRRRRQAVPPGQRRLPALVSGSGGVAPATAATLTPDQVKQLLTKSRGLPETDERGAGAGILDVKGAVEPRRRRLRGAPLVQTYPTATGTGSTRTGPRARAMWADPPTRRPRTAARSSGGHRGTGAPAVANLTGPGPRGPVAAGREFVERHEQALPGAGRSWTNKRIVTSWLISVSSWSDDAWSGHQRRALGQPPTGSLSRPPTGEHLHPFLHTRAGCPMPSSRAVFSLQDQFPSAPGPTWPEIHRVEHVCVGNVGALGLCIVVLGEGHLPPLRTSLVCRGTSSSPVPRRPRSGARRICPPGRDAHSFSLSEIPFSWAWPARARLPVVRPGRWARCRRCSSPSAPVGV